MLVLSLVHLVVCVNECFGHFLHSLIENTTKDLNSQSMKGFWKRYTEIPQVTPTLELYPHLRFVKNNITLAI